MQMLSSRWAWTPLLVAAFSIAGSVRAEEVVTCFATCSGGKSCSTSMAPNQNVDKQWITNCKDKTLTVQTGCMRLRYLSNGTFSNSREICEKAPLAPVLVAADTRCSGFWSCLTPPPASVGPGSNPVGPDAVATTGSAAGLPYGTILVTGAASIWTATGSEGGKGTLLISEAGKKSALPAITIAAGRAELKPGTLRPSSSYEYRWQTDRGTLSGSFNTSSAEASADVLPPAGLPRDDTQWEQINNLMAYGYWWDALQAARLLTGK